ncbi:hypothetical protein [Halomonas ramblicola]|uniref:hypothetical protein n=1 Tax=Halomonas ramblicola TaxID=747349 RepID=UPI0025B5B0EA|nr:hypothetical protein [Halomonas ramblicola]MDN3521897.1 hypothetical protein [Halomonas ramblicola]
MKTPRLAGGWRYLPLLLLPCAALADDGHDLSFQGDASFQGPHGGQAIEAALVDADSGEVLARQDGSVSAEDDPAFVLDFPGALQEGRGYEVHYWIDSNFGGGSEGACDPMEHDHQWRVTLDEADEADEAVTHVEDHDPGRMTEACSTFME